MAPVVDLVVIGGGLAGSSSAARAAELGAKVLLLEQGEDEHYPCNSRYSGGMFHLYYHDIDLAPDALAASLTRMSPVDVDRELVGVIARNTRRCVRWLQEQGGARFVRVGPNPFEKWVLAPPRPPKAGLVHPGRGPDVVLGHLAKSLAARGMPVRRGARVVDVERDAGGFTVSVITGAQRWQVRARAVVFADGGFQGNPELVSRHITPDRSRLLQRNAQTGMGRGLEIAGRLGARLSELQSFYGHLVARRALDNPALWPYPMVDGLANAGVLVGPDGLRFADEGRTGVYLANQVAQRANPTDAVVVFDDDTWWSVGRETRVPPNPVLTNHGGELVSSDTIEGLAALAGIAPTALAETVRTHNAAVAGRDATLLQPLRTLRAKPPPPILKPPFHAVPVCAGITYTMGGIRVDAGARVLAQDGGTLPGLFAAGSAVGGIEGGAFAFYIGGLCKALVLGMLAAESAVATLNSTSIPSTQGAAVNEHFA